MLIDMQTHMFSSVLFPTLPGNVVFNLCIKHDVKATRDRLSEDTFFLGILLLCTVQSKKVRDFNKKAI